MELQINKQAYRVGLKINKRIKWVVDFVRKALLVFLMVPMVYFLLLSIDNSEFLNSWHIGEALNFIALFMIPFTIGGLCSCKGKLSVKVILDVLSGSYFFAFSFYSTMMIGAYKETVGYYHGMWVLFIIWVLGMMLVIIGLIALSFIVKLICLLIDYKERKGGVKCSG